MHTHTHKDINEQTNKQTNKQTDKQTHKQTHKQSTTRTHAHTNTNTHTHTHPHTHAHTYPRTRAPTHTHTHAHTRTRAHTHTHTRTRAAGLGRLWRMTFVTLMVLMTSATIIFMRMSFELLAMSNVVQKIKTRCCNVKAGRLRSALRSKVMRPLAARQESCFCLKYLNSCRSWC